MDLTQYLAIFRRRKWIITLVAGMTVAIVALGTLLTTPTYVASATLRVATATDGALEKIGWDDIQYADRLMNTYTHIAAGEPLQEELARRLGLEKPPVTGIAIRANSELLDITAEAQDPALAAKSANTLADLLISRARGLETQGGQTTPEILSAQLVQIEQQLKQARNRHERLVVEDSQGADAIATARRELELKERTHAVLLAQFDGRTNPDLLFDKLDEIERLLGEARENYEQVVTGSRQVSEEIAAAKREVELKEQSYASLLDQFERARITEAIRANTLSVVDLAVAPTAPAKPQSVLNLGLALLIGLAGGTGLAFLFENLDSTLHTSEQIKLLTDLPMLAKFPTSKTMSGGFFFADNSIQEEAFRRLRTNIFARRDGAPLRTLLVTSPGPREGKSTVVANLACAIARSGRTVVVVDADVRVPTLHKVFGVSNKKGLSSVFKETLSLEEAVQITSSPGIWVLPSGRPTSNPGELFDAPQAEALIGQLKEQFDVILFDTSALGVVTDAAVLAPTVDGVVLVIERAQTRREAVLATLQQLTNVKACAIGVVINRAEPETGHNYYERRDVAWQEPDPSGSVDVNRSLGRTRQQQESSLEPVEFS